MKKLLATLSLICLFAVSSMAQTEFHWGFKGGINFTTFDSDADDIQARMGQWGLVARWKFNENIALQSELFYARMGARSIKKVVNHFRGTETYYDHGSNQDQVFRLMLLTDNIQLPILAKWYLPVNMFGGRGLNIHVGPLMSYAFEYKISTSSPEGFLADPAFVGQSDATSNTNVSDRRIKIQKIGQARNKFTVHGVAGIGYDSPSGIGVDLRYQMGITPVWNDSKVGCYNSHSHDRVYSICFSYTF